jgi:cell division protease FtsH
MTREELGNKMAVLLGGRASEHLVFEHLSTGAADDLAKATDIARGMVTRYGMDEALGHVVYQDETPVFLGNQPNLPAHREVSNETAEKIDQAVRTFVQAAFDNAKAILLRHRETLERGAQLLLAQETLTEPELATLQETLPVAAIQSAAVSGDRQ